jgi:NAD(P)-dependent dehydrogenase (short-subunit alcohol dehydrogenase family)
LQTAGAQAYRDSFEVGVVAVHGLLQASMQALKKAVRECGDASVINMASMYGMVSPDPRIYDSPTVANPPFYGAAKGALLQLTRYAACELGPIGIRVNSISPGAFPSEAVRTSSPDFISRLSARIPLGRPGRAEEIVGPLLFLASPASSYVNGANLVVDGGWTSW